MSPEPVAAEALASRLLAQLSSRPEASEPGGDAVVARLSCEQVYGELARWLGPGSARALLSRGLAAARLDHPAVTQVRVGENGESVIDDASAIATHGSAAVAAGLRAVLTTMLDLLGRLVGNDLASRLLNDTVTGGDVHDERSK